MIAVSLPTSLPDDESHALADRIAARVDAPSSLDVGRGTASLLALPQVIGRGRRIVVLARADWPGATRLRAALDELVPGWVAVGSAPIDGVDGLSHALAGLIGTLQAADRMIRVGWIDDADDLAVERLLLLDESLLEKIVQRELGPLLAEARMGGEFVETLRVYFEAGEYMRAHLASYTLASIAEMARGGAPWPSTEPAAALSAN